MNLSTHRGTAGANKYVDRSVPTYDLPETSTFGRATIPRGAMEGVAKCSAIMSLLAFSGIRSGVLGKGVAGGTRWTIAGWLASNRASTVGTVEYSTTVSS